MVFPFLYHSFVIFLFYLQEILCGQRIIGKIETFSPVMKTLRLKSRTTPAHSLQNLIFGTYPPPSLDFPHFQKFFLYGQNKLGLSCAKLRSAQASFPSASNQLQCLQISPRTTLTKMYQKKVYYRFGIWHRYLTNKLKISGPQKFWVL